MSLPNELRTLIVWDLEDFLENKLSGVKDVASRTSDLPAYKRWNLYQRDFYRCSSCGLEGNKVLSFIEKGEGVRIYVLAAEKGGGYEGFTMDHIIPRSLGGTNAYINLTTMCETCNRRKSHTIPDGVVIAWTPSDCKVCEVLGKESPYLAEVKCSKHGGIYPINYGRVEKA